MKELIYIPIETAWLLTENDIYCVDLLNVGHLSADDGCRISTLDTQDSFPSTQISADIHLSS